MWNGVYGVCVIWACKELGVWNGVCVSYGCVRNWVCGMGYIVCVIWVCKELGVWNGVYSMCHMGV